MYSAYIFSVAVLFLSRSAFVALVAICLLAGIGGGLVRAGVGVPGGVIGGLTGDWIGAAVLSHAFLMICGFLGTVIGIERAVAVKTRLAFVAPAASGLAFVAPAASGLAGLLALAGAPTAAAWLAVAAAAAFTGVNLLVVARQRAAHTLVLLAGAMAWLVGNLLHARGTLSSGVIPWWFSFLILTIAAERLEMTRLMRRSAGAAPALYAALGLLLVGAGWSATDPAAGGVLYGISLLCLALWLGRFDIARRTVRARGLSRYMAVCLLLGYFWLALAGIAWAAASLGHPARDAALHGLAVGFVFSMILGHAPVILPAVLRVKLLFGPVFYLPLALLHASLALRIFGAPMAPELLQIAAAGHALAIAAFALTMAAAAAPWHLKYSSTPPHHGHDHAVEN